MQKITSHYQKKLNRLRIILDLYQEKVEKKKADWEQRIEVSSSASSPLLSYLAACCLDGCCVLCVYTNVILYLPAVGLDSTE